MVVSSGCPYSPDELKFLASKFHVTNMEVMEPEPYTLFKAFREHLPSFRSELHGGFHVFTRHADQRAILRDPQHFSSRTVTIPPLPGGGFGPPTESDPPNHALYRRALDLYFTTKRFNEKRDELRDKAVSFLEPMVRRGSGEFMAEFCRPLPTVTFFLLAGLPLEDLPRLQSWTDQLLHGHGDEAAREHNSAVIAPSVHKYFLDRLEEREAMSDPPDDVLTGVTRAKLGDVPWSRRDQILAIMQLVFAGLETITSMLGLALLYLAEHPEQLTQLVDDPELIPDAVEEFLRYNTSEQTVRTVLSDVEVGGVQLHKGDRVQLPLASSGRDDLAFPDADTVDFTRRPARHLAFGAGPHRCMGSHVARTELRIALEEVVRMMPRFELAPGAKPRRTWGMVFGLANLEVVLR
jgi:cytochrome P450